MIPFSAHLDSGAVFEPDALRAMSQAFQEACNELQISAGDDGGRRAVATRIIYLASTGVIDARALRDRVQMEARAFA